MEQQQKMVSEKGLTQERTQRVKAEAFFSSNMLRSIDIFVPSEIVNENNFKGYMCNWRVTGNLGQDLIITYLCLFYFLYTVFYKSTYKGMKIKCLKWEKRGRKEAKVEIKEMIVRFIYK